MPCPLANQGASGQRRLTLGESPFRCAGRASVQGRPAQRATAHPTLQVVPQTFIAVGVIAGVPSSIRMRLIDASACAAASAISCGIRSAAVANHHWASTRQGCHHCAMWRCARHHQPASGRGAHGDALRGFFGGRAGAWGGVPRQEAGERAAPPAGLPPGRVRRREGSFARHDAIPWLMHWLASAGWCGCGRDLLFGQNQLAQRGLSQAVHDAAVIDVKLGRTAEELLACNGRHMGSRRPTGATLGRGVPLCPALQGVGSIGHGSVQSATLRWQRKEAIYDKCEAFAIKNCGLRATVWCPACTMGIRPLQEERQ